MSGFFAAYREGFSLDPPERDGGDGTGAHGVSLHGLDAVLVAVDLALQSGRVSAEHVLNLLSRLQEQRVAEPPVAPPCSRSTRCC